MEIYEHTIKRLAAKPIVNVNFDLKFVHVKFEDGNERTTKLDLPLRIFFMTMQRVQYIRKTVTPNCTSIPLDHFLLLGWSAGDCVEFNIGTAKLAIVFS